MPPERLSRPDSSRFGTKASLCFPNRLARAKKGGFQGKMSDYADKATSYSGQLNLYQKVVEASYPDSPRPSTWIHFITTGSAIQVSS